MREQLLYPENPDLLDDAARECVVGLLVEPGWMAYATVLNPTLDKWIDRFITLHAKVPSVIQMSDKQLFVSAAAPIKTFRCLSEDRRILIDGGFFANGAVIRCRSGNQTQKILLVEKSITELFKYNLIGKETHSVKKDKNNDVNAC